MIYIVFSPEEETQGPEDVKRCKMIKVTWKQENENSVYKKRMLALQGSDAWANSR